jgi:Na+-driven multidrug efflux pump
LSLETVSVFGWFEFPGFGLGVMGVWYAMTIDWLIRSVLYLTRYLSKKWLSFYKLKD